MVTKTVYLSPASLSTKIKFKPKKLNRTKRIPKPRKQSETGSTEVNKVKRAITGNSSTTSSRMGRRARLTSQARFSHPSKFEVQI